MSVSATLGVHFNAENTAQNPETLNLLFLLFSAPPLLCSSSSSSLDPLHWSSHCQASSVYHCHQKGGDREEASPISSHPVLLIDLVLLSLINDFITAGLHEKKNSCLIFVVDVVHT